MYFKESTLYKSEVITATTSRCLATVLPLSGSLRHFLHNAHVCFPEVLVLDEAISVLPVEGEEPGKVVVIEELGCL